MIPNFMGIVGRSQAMQDIFSTIEKVADRSCNVLIEGETGTGKELIAKAIHLRGNRKGGPFVIVDCSAIPETLIESELFGHVKGAFTGAVTNRVGKIEEANGGTLFMDEIGEISQNVQAKLLRAIEEKVVERLGSNKRIDVDVRIIAATNRDLEVDVKEGRFRQDLWYRLNVVRIQVPPLRERREDIPLLVEHFMEGFGKPKKISDEAMECLMRYNWPGNVRELKNAIERALVMGDGGVLLIDHLPPEIRNGDGKAGVHLGISWIRELSDLNLDRFESILIEEALRRARGNKSRAAKLLGINRRTLLYKLRNNYHGILR